MTELERRLAALEGLDRPASVPAPPPGDSFWALTKLQEELSQADVANGGVVFAGSVRLPTEEQYAWQQTFVTDDLVEGEWEGAADAFAALGHAVRLRLLREILGGHRTAAELTALEGVGTTGQIYHHLRQLAATGWLHTASRGRYEVPPGRVVPLLVALAATRH